MGYSPRLRVIGDWFSLFSRGRKKPAAQARTGAIRSRRLRHEPLEDRRVLAVYVVTSTADTSGLTATAGSGTEGDPYQIATLRSAIEQTNAAAGADIINFNSLFNSAQTIKLDGDLALSIEGDLTINGPGRDLLTIDANENGNVSQVFTSNDGTTANASVVLVGMTLTGGAGSNGGGISSLENLTLDGMRIAGNEGYLNGGGLYQAQAIGATEIPLLRLTDTIVESNVATATINSGGGGLSVQTSHLEILHGSIIGGMSEQAGNIGAARGGGLSWSAPDEASLTILDSTIAYNTAGQSGGGIDMAGPGVGAAFIARTTFTENESGIYGGGAILLGGPTTIHDSTFIQNYTEGEGGAISNHAGNFNPGQNLTIVGSQFKDNSAEINGGALSALLNGIFEGACNIFCVTFAGEH